MASRGIDETNPGEPLAMLGHFPDLSDRHAGNSSGYASVGSRGKEEFIVFASMQSLFHGRSGEYGQGICCDLGRETGFSA